MRAGLHRMLECVATVQRVSEAETIERTMKVFKAIEAVMADLSKIGIGKDKTNQQQGFKYRGVDDVMNELSALLPKHGLLILPRVTKYSSVERVSAKGNPLFYTIL